MAMSDKNISEQIELLHEIIKVKSSIKENVSEDYTLAKLDIIEKEFIIENYENAEYAKALIEKFANKGYTYKWNEKQLEWDCDEYGKPIRHGLTDEEKKIIMARAKRIFDFFMCKPHMIAITARNTDKNFLIKVIGNSKEEEEPVTFGRDDRSILQKMSDKIKGEPQIEEIE